MARPAPLDRLGEICGSYLRFSITILILWALQMLPAEVSADALKDQMFEAWRSRQNSVETATFEWTEERLFTRGSLNGPDPGPDDRPKVDTTITIPGIRLLLADGKVRHYTEMRSSRLNSGVQKETTSAFDGVDNTSYWTPVGQIGGNGYVHTAASYDEAGMVDIRALTLAFRALDPKIIGLHPDHYEETPAETIINGSRCIMLKEINGRRISGIQDLVYVDIDKGFSPIRWCETFEGKVYVQIDIGYIRDASFGWIPNTWRKMSFKPDGSLSTATTATVNSFTINEPIAPHEFRISFPPGTRVANENTGEEYLILVDGSHRPLSNWGYVDLRANGGPPAMVVASGILLFLAIVLLIAFGLQWRRKRISRSRHC